MAKRETIEYLPPQRTDQRGDPVGPVPPPVEVRGVKAWPRTSDESGTEVIIDGYGLRLPRRAPVVSALGRVKFRGKTWEVDGVPGVFSGKATIVFLKRVGS